MPGTAQSWLCLSHCTKMLRLGCTKSIPVRSDGSSDSGTVREENQMGWMNAEEQRAAKRNFHITAQYMCDECNEPIQSGEAPVIDPKAGYHPWPVTLPDNCKAFLSRNPKVTRHLQCDRIKRGTRTKPPSERRSHVSDALNSVLEAVLSLIKGKPRPGYWTKEKCCRKLKEAHDKKLVLKAIRTLRREGQLKKKSGGYLPA
jgi:hypothetical protein